MKVANIIEAEQEAKRFLKRLDAVRNSQGFERGDHTDTSKETGALKRSSMDLTRSLSKMRNDIW